MRVFVERNTGVWFGGAGGGGMETILGDGGGVICGEKYWGLGAAMGLRRVLECGGDGRGLMGRVDTAANIKASVCGCHGCRILMKGQIQSC